MAIPILSGVGDALNWYQRNVSDPVSGSILLGLNSARQGLGLGDQGTDTLSHFGSGLPGSDPSSALNYAYQDNPLGRFAFQTATDPLNLVGTGAIPGIASKIPLLSHAAPLLGAIDKLPNAAVGGIMDKIGGALHDPVLDAAGKLGPYLDKFGDANTGLRDNWMRTNMIWKELAHTVPSYPVKNLVDDTLRQASYGDLQSAGDIVKAFPSAMRATVFDGTKTDIGAARDWQDTFGGDLSHAITDTGVASVGPESQFRQWQSKVPRTDPSKGPLYDQYGNQVMEPAVKNLKDALLDPLSRLGEFSKKLEQNQELATRGPVWGNAATDALRPYANDMATRLDNSGFHGLAGDFAGRNGMMSPSELEAELTSLGHADPRGVGESWMNAQQTAEKAADDWTNKTQFQYRNQPYQDRLSELDGKYPGTFSGLPTNTTGLQALDYTDDSLMRSYAGGDVDRAKDLSKALRQAHGEQVLRNVAQNTFGGYKFATQNVPAMARLSGQYPAIANVPAEYYRDSDIYNAQHGHFGAGFHGMMPVGSNPLNGDQIMFNPANLSSIAELVGGMTDQSGENGEGLGQLANTLGDVSLGLNPLLKLGLQVSGQLGNNQMPSVIRPLTLGSGVASLATGSPVDLEQPLKNVIGGVEQAITGRETFPYQDYLMRQRQAELSGTGNKWDATQTSGPIHDAASVDTAHRLGAGDLLQTLTPFDVKMVSPEAQHIAQNAAIANYAGARGLTSVASANPTAQSYALADPLAERVARFETLPVDERIALLRDPRALELLQKQRMLQLHNPQALAAG